MSAKRDDGGAAFPLPVAIDDSGIVNRPPDGERGMTLRDYFAASALQALVAKEGSTAYAIVGTLGFADAAYAYADAMLEARKR